MLDSTLINIIILNDRAARYGKLNAVRKLVSMTAKVDATNINGQTALHIGKHSKTTLNKKETRFFGKDNFFVD